MLNAKEKELLIDLLSNAELFDVISVANLISGSHLRPTTFEDAIQIICQHSSNIQSVIERKKIKKEVLYTYLHKNNVSVTESFSKQSLTTKIVEFWEQKCFEGPSVNSVPIHIPVNTNQQVEISSNTVSQYYEEGFHKELSIEFAEWFYKLYNDIDPSKLGADHFFPNCVTMIHCESVNNTQTFEAFNNNDSARILQEVKMQFSLYFLPNVTPTGIKSKEEMHGQVYVLVSGSLHRAQEIIGLFEQAFVLNRDPSAGNAWKINKCNLRLTSNT